MSSEEITETTENYLKEIYLLILQYDFARVSDIARRLNRSLSTVSGAIKRMGEDGLLNYEKYGKITLTEKGERLAESIVSNFNLIVEFLQTIGVEEHQAKIDACEMEHVSDETISQLSEFINYITTNKGAKKTIDEFTKIG